jgi:hypothetical protein
LTPIKDKCIPIFFIIKSIEDDGITDENVNCSLVKKGDGSCFYKPNWDSVLQTELG